MNILNSSSNWRFFCEVWVAASLLWPQGLFKVFRLILTTLRSGWSWSFFWFPISSFSFPSLWGSLLKSNYLSGFSLSFIFPFLSAGLLLLFLFLLLLYSLHVFHTSIGWYVFTWVWGTASLKSPGRFLVFWPISKMLLSRWSPFFFRLSILPILFLNLLGPFQVHLLPLVSPSPVCHTAFLVI